MTSADTLTSQTDHSFTYLTALDPNATALQCGTTLMSYESWMTKDFAFNISVQSCSDTNTTIRFLLYQETYFAKAKVHFIVIWQDGVNNAANGYYHMECIYGCKSSVKQVISLMNSSLTPTTTIATKLSAARRARLLLLHTPMPVRW